MDEVLLDLTGFEKWFRRELMQSTVLELEEKLSQVIVNTLHSQDLALRARDEEPERDFQVCDLVLVRNFKVDSKKADKLDPRWVGPFEVREVSYHKSSVVVGIVGRFFTIRSLFIPVGA